MMAVGLGQGKSGSAKPSKSSSGGASAATKQDTPAKSNNPEYDEIKQYSNFADIPPGKFVFTSAAEYQRLRSLPYKVDFGQGITAKAVASRTSDFSYKISDGNRSRPIDRRGLQRMLENPNARSATLTSFNATQLARL